MKLYDFVFTLTRFLYSGLGFFFGLRVEPLGQTVMLANYKMLLIGALIGLISGSVIAYFALRGTRGCGWLAWLAIDLCLCLTSGFVGGVVIKFLFA